MVARYDMPDAQFAQAKRDTVRTSRVCSHLSSCGETGRIKGMVWLDIFIKTIMEWLLKFPQDLLSHKVEGVLDRVGERGGRKRKVRHHKPRNHQTRKKTRK